MSITSNVYCGPHGVDFKWAYSRKDPLSADPRIVVHVRGSDGGEGAMRVFGPSSQGDIEVRTQDAETYSQRRREWWTFGSDETAYPGRRIAATLKFLTKRYGIDVRTRGITVDALNQRSGISWLG